MANEDVDAGLRLPLRKATAYAAKVLGFQRSNASLRFEDVEDAASEAWFKYFRFWQTTGRDEPRRFRWWVISLVRKHAGEIGSRKHGAISCASDGAEIVEPFASDPGFENVDLADDVDAFRRRGHRFFADVLDLRLMGYTAADACRALQYTPPNFAHARRRAMPA